MDDTPTDLPLSPEDRDVLAQALRICRFHKRRTQNRDRHAAFSITENCLEYLVSQEVK